MGRRSLGREFWERVIADVEAGRGSQREIARRHGVSVTGLQRWLYTMRRERASRAVCAPAVQLLPVRLIESPPEQPAWLAELKFAGMTLRFGTAAEPIYVASVLRALSC